MCRCRHGLTRERVSAAVTNSRVERNRVSASHDGLVVDFGPPASTGFSCVNIWASGLDRLPPCQFYLLRASCFDGLPGCISLWSSSNRAWVSRFPCRCDTCGRPWTECGWGGYLWEGFREVGEVGM